jgi:hypothetical protein
MQTKALDPHIWKPLPALADGFVPHVKRAYMLDAFRGSPSSILVELESHHHGEHYVAIAHCADQLHFVCHTSICLSAMREVL